MGNKRTRLRLPVLGMALSAAALSGCVEADKLDEANVRQDAYYAEHHGLLSSSALISRTAWDSPDHRADTVLDDCPMLENVNYPSRATIHHTVGSYGPSIVSCPDSPSSGCRQLDIDWMLSLADQFPVEALITKLRDLQVSQRDTLCDIAYHFLISPDGLLAQGAPDERSVSFHSLGVNTANVGISFIGNHQGEGVVGSGVGEDPDVPLGTQPLDQALITGAQTLGFLRSVYGIEDIQGHRSRNATACPGALLDDDVPWMEMCSMYLQLGGQSSCPSLTGEGPEVDVSPLPFKPFPVSIAVSTTAPNQGVPTNSLAITLANSGDEALTKVVVRASLPAGSRITSSSVEVSAVASAAASYGHAYFDLTFGPLDPGERSVANLQLLRSQAGYVLVWPRRIWDKDSRISYGDQNHFIGQSHISVDRYDAALACREAILSGREWRAACSLPRLRLEKIGPSASPAPFAPPPPDELSGFCQSYSGTENHANACPTKSVQGYGPVPEDWGHIAQAGVFIPAR